RYHGVLFFRGRRGSLRSRYSAGLGHTSGGTRRTSTEGSDRHRGRGAGRASARSLWGNGSTGFATLLPRLSRANSGLERGCRVVPRKGLGLHRARGCLPKRLQPSGPGSHGRMVRRKVEHWARVEVRIGKMADETKKMTPEQMATRIADL